MPTADVSIDARLFHRRARDLALHWKVQDQESIFQYHRDFESHHNKKTRHLQTRSDFALSQQCKPATSVHTLTRCAILPPTRNPMDPRSLSKMSTRCLLSLETCRTTTTFTKRPLPCRYALRHINYSNCSPALTGHADSLFSSDCRLGSLDMSLLRP